jgi:diketogulonate reductase-like aldo/keto reductase
MEYIWSTLWLDWRRAASENVRLVCFLVMSYAHNMLTRREFLVASGCSLAIAGSLGAERVYGRSSMLTRKVPRTGEALPVIGMGTWQTFDVSPAQRGGLVDVLGGLLAGGGRVIDSSPMYGQAEEATGDVVARAGAVGKLFLATKVWTRGKAAGLREMTRSLERLRVQRLDLMQIHNLLDWQIHLPVLREWKQAGKVRYIGITHYAQSAFAELEQLLRTEMIDFIQLPYNVMDRAAEKRLLPAAADTGTAVLVMRPFAEGALLRRVHGRPVPEWAAEVECTSWAQLFLKFIVAHSTVTCPIPATSNPKHMADNIQAGFGHLPDEALRRKIVAAIG